MKRKNTIYLIIILGLLILAGWQSWQISTLQNTSIPAHQQMGNGDKMNDPEKGMVALSKSENARESKSSSSLSKIGKKVRYVCPMHSHIVSDKEGRCPICGMALVEKTMTESKMTERSGNTDETLETTDGSNIETQNHHHVVKVNNQLKQNLAIKTARVQKGNIAHKIETIGKITRVDPMARTRYTSPLNGSITDISEKYAGDKVKQGEWLFSVSSKWLLDAQKEYQSLFSDGKKAEAAKLFDQLAAMGLDASQLSNLQSNNGLVKEVKVYARENGYVFARRGQVGDAVTTAFTVFNLGGDYQVIEVTVEIFERQWDLVKEGQHAKIMMRNMPGVVFEGQVERVDEPVGYTTRALEARIKFKTQYQGLTQSTFARVLIDGKVNRNVLWVPSQAIIRTERGARVVKQVESGIYQPVAVKIGEQGESKVEIIEGLDEGDKIVSSGQFLIDSESNLLSALSRMSHSNAQSDATHEHN